MRRQAVAIDAKMDGLAIVQGDTYIYMNPAHARMYGSEPGELIGRSWMDIYDSTEVGRIRREIFPELLRQRHWSGETRGRRKDGTEITVDISHTITESGDLICACRDNTQRALQNEAIRRSQEQLELVLDATNDGFLDRTPAGVTYSRRWMELLGYQPGDLTPCYETWVSLLHPDDRQRVLAENEAFFRGDIDFFSSEYRLKTKSGGWCWVHDRGKVVLRTADGRALRAVGTHSDITARRTAALVQQRQASELIELNDELARAARGRGEFLARVSHERRTLLAGILAISEMLLDGSGKNFDASGTLKIQSIRESSNRLLDLINEILDLAKLEAGQARLCIEGCHATEIAQESIRLVSPLAQRQKLEIGFQCEGRPIRVAAIPLRPAR